MSDTTDPNVAKLAQALEQAKPDPIAELLAHLAERAGQIEPGAAFHGGPLDGASRYNVAQAGIREIVAWDFQRRKPFTDDCMGCGGEGVLCAEQGATGYPLCLDCYFQAVTELEPRAGDEPRALWPVRWNTEALAQYLDAHKRAPGGSMGAALVMLDGEPCVGPANTRVTSIVDDVDDYDDTPDPAGGWDPSEPEGWDNSTGKE